MSDAEKFAKAFRAAARGAMYPFYGSPQNQLAEQQLAQQQGRICWNATQFSSESFDRAKSIQGAFEAIAEVFEKIAEAESQPTA